MKMNKPKLTLVLSLLFLVASAASAKISVRDLELAEEATWSSMGNLKACSSKFSEPEYGLVSVKLNLRLREMIAASNFLAENLDMVQKEKISLSEEIMNAALGGSKDLAARKKLCFSELESANGTLQFMSNKIKKSKSDK